MLKTLLAQFIKIHSPHQTQLSADMLKFAQQHPSFINNIYLLNHSQNKLKQLFLIMQQLKGNHFYYMMFFTVFGYSYYYRIEIINSFNNILSQQDQIQLQKVEKPSITGTNLIINEVLKKESINNMLGDLIVKIDKKESTQHNVSKQLCKLGQISFLYDKTFLLTRELLISQIFNNEEIQLKFRDLLIKVIKDQKHQIVDLISDQLKNNLMKIAAEQIVILWEQEGFQQGLSNALINAIYGYLDDKNTVIELLKLL